MAAGLPLPKTIYAHGWWTVEGDKMSKSKGNVVDPIQMADTYGADAFRYFLLRELPFGQDGGFSPTAFVQRINSDLANDLGNLTSRSIAMVEKYAGGMIPKASADNDIDKALKQLANKSLQGYCEAMERLSFDQALRSLWEFIGKANQYIDESQPWQLAKGLQTDPAQKPKLDSVLYNLMESLRLISIAISPFMPTMANQLRGKLSLPPIDSQDHQNRWLEQINWGGTMSGTKVEKGAALFQRIEIKTT
jgi:methionyl-tRNA synthetase